MNMAKTKHINKVPSGLDCNTVFVVAPKAIDIKKYAAARAQEMEAMASVSSRVWGNNKAMQTLPRHMRRRAASHNVRRLPSRLRKKGEREMAKSGPPANLKRPGRFHRRRPSNLLLDYKRRARNNVWLETHIWHAKRFHMTDRWGYRVPLHPNDKSIRAAYRGASKYCIMQDISFMCCVEIRGPQKSITDALSRLTHSDTGPGFGAVRFLSGVREGNVMIYKHDQYPHSAIGPVKFLWKPTNGTNESDLRQLWLWVHPSAYNQLMQELKDIFGINNEVLSIQTPENGKASKAICKGNSENIPKSKMKKKNKSEEKLTVDDVRPSAFDAVTFTNGEVTVTSLKDLLGRFHLSGPLSHVVLQDLLHKADVEEGIKEMGDLIATDDNQNTGKQSEEDRKETGDKKSYWWKDYYLVEGRRECHERQNDIWDEMKGLQSAGELGPGVVLGLSVRDPRIFLPKKRTQVVNDEQAVAEYTLDCVKQWPSGVSSSPIWESDVRENVKTARMTEQEMNKLRSEHLVPGTQLELGEDESRIPVLLIQHTGSRVPSHQYHHPSTPGLPPGWGAGWDIILPQNWSMAFWVGLIYRGARATGLKESLSTSTELGELHMPEGFPDTQTGHEVEAQDKVTMESKYKRMPPAKRPNYTKLGTVAPFHYPWKTLISEWTPASQKGAGDGLTTQSVDITVFRNKRTLSKLDKLCLPQNKSRGQTFKVRRVALGQKSVHQSVNRETNQGDINLSEVIQGCQSHLVAVRLRAVQRGVLGPFSMICLPTEEDLAALSKDNNYAGPLEPRHKDPDFTTKKDRKKAKVRATLLTMVANSTKNKKPDSDKSNEAGEIKEKGNVMESKEDKCSGLVTTVSALRYSSSRQVVGYVKQGGYHFGDGAGAGVGFLVLQALVELLDSRKTNSPLIVLVRSARSNQYRFAYLNIVL